MTFISDLLAQRRTLSYEFFPAKTDQARAALDRTLEALQPTNPDFVSVTYGAAGSDRHRTRDVVLDIERDYPFPAMAHLTCLGHAKGEIDALLADYVGGGVANILALGGDPPADGSTPPPGDFDHAIDLVEYLRDRLPGSIGVAAHPEGHPRSPDLGHDRRHLAEKLRRADFAMTQFFFDVDHYRSLVDDLADRGCTKPVIPGVIPITNAAQVQRFAFMAGATIPRDLAERIEAVADEPDKVRAIGVATAAQLAHQLLEAGAPGLHFYTLNRADAVLEVLDRLDFDRG